MEAITLAPGAAEGATLRLDEPLSFWGGLELATGRVIDRWHPQRNMTIAGSALMMPAGRGSSSGSAALAETMRLGAGPAAILLLRRDAIVVVGALAAAELYGLACPVVLADQDWEASPPPPGSPSSGPGRRNDQRGDLTSRAGRAPPSESPDDAPDAPCRRPAGRLARLGAGRDVGHSPLWRPARLSPCVRRVRPSGRPRRGGRS